MTPITRQRIMTEALRLFGENGFAATSVARIEQAAGLSPGSGALYRHFRSKNELLVESVRARLADRGEWGPFLSDEFSIVDALGGLGDGLSLEDCLLALCHIGLARLEHDRDVSRILMRDNSVDPQVLEVFRREEFGVVTAAVAKAFEDLATEPGDWEASAAVIVGAVAHYWLISDAFGGEHPLAIDADRYLRATAQMIAARIAPTGAIGERSVPQPAPEVSTTTR